MVSSDRLATWFQEMKQYMNAKDPMLLTSPEHIFNADKSGFSICPKTKKIISMTGAKHVYSIISSTSQQVTVLVCISAIG